MQVWINQQPHTLPEGASLADAVAAVQARAPYAAAVNLDFVPRERHAEHILHEGDRIEIVAPITGG